MLLLPTKEAISDTTKKYTIYLLSLYNMYRLTEHSSIAGIQVQNPKTDTYCTHYRLQK